MTAATAGADSKCQTPRRRLAALTLARVLTALIYGYLSSSYGDASLSLPGLAPTFGPGRTAQIAGF